MVSPIGSSAAFMKLAATSAPSAAIVLSMVSCIKKAFCAAVVKKASITTPINAETIAPPRTIVEKFLKRYAIITTDNGIKTPDKKYVENMVRLVPIKANTSNSDIFSPRCFCCLKRLSAE